MFAFEKLADNLYAGIKSTKPRHKFFYLIQRSQGNVLLHNFDTGQFKKYQIARSVNRKPS